MATIKIIYETTPDEVLGEITQQYGKLKSDRYLNTILEQGLLAFVKNLQHARGVTTVSEEDEESESEILSDAMQQEWIRELYSSLNEEQIAAVKQGLGSYWSLFEGAATVERASSSAHMIEALALRVVAPRRVAPDVGSFVHLFDPKQRASFAKLFEH